MKYEAGKSKKVIYWEFFKKNLAKIILKIGLLFAFFLFFLGFFLQIKTGTYLETYYFKIYSIQCFEAGFLALLEGIAGAVIAGALLKKSEKK